MTTPTVLLVLPCYRDATRLARYLPGLCLELGAHLSGVQVQVVEDGSPAGEQDELADLIAALRHQHDFLQPLLAYSPNRGKGHAIRTGWGAAPAAPLLAFVDADGAVPAPEVVALLRRAQAAVAPALFIADRTGGAAVERYWYRHVGSRVYNRWVRFWLGLDLPDTQCGLKVLPTDFYRAQAWQEERFAFDLELLLAARAAGLPVVRQPIAWTEKPDSRLGLRAVFSLFADAVRLRRR